VAAARVKTARLAMNLLFFIVDFIVHFITHLSEPDTILKPSMS
jgi:hypothetical protein